MRKALVLASLLSLAPLAFADEKVRPPEGGGNHDLNNFIHVCQDFRHDVLTPRLFKTEYFQWVFHEIASRFGTNASEPLRDWASIRYLKIVKHRDGTVWVVLGKGDLGGELTLAFCDNFVSAVPVAGPAVLYPLRRNPAVGGEVVRLSAVDPMPRKAAWSVVVLDSGLVLDVNGVVEYSHYYEIKDPAVREAVARLLGASVGGVRGGYGG